MRQTCRIPLSTLVLLLAVSGRTVLSQESRETSSTSFRIGVSAGLSTFALKDLRDFTSEAVSIYTGAGVPVELQREYPPNLVAGAEFFFTGLDPLSIGVGGSYTWTGAYARYADFAGTLDLTSRVKVLSGNLILQYAVATGPALRPFFDLRGGFSRVSLSLEEAIGIIADYGGAHVNSEISGTKTGFGGEASAGLRYVLGSLAFSARAGYHYSSVSSMPLTISSAGTNLGSGSLAFDMNTSGFLGAVSLEISF